MGSFTTYELCARRIHARRWLELESIWLPRAVSKEVLGEKQEAIVVPEKAQVGVCVCVVF